MYTGSTRDSSLVDVLSAFLGPPQISLVPQRLHLLQVKNQLLRSCISAYFGHIIGVLADSSDCGGTQQMVEKRGKLFPLTISCVELAIHFSVICIILQ